MDGAGVPVEFSKGEAGTRPARDQPRATPTRSRWPTATSSTRTGPRRSRRSPGARSRSWRSTRWTRSGSSCHVHSSLWDADGEQSLMWERRRARPPVAGVPRLARRAARRRPRARVAVRADRQLLQALPARVVGADRARVGARQPHVRVPRRRARAGVPGRVPHPRRRREPLPRVRGDDRGRPARHRARPRPARPVRRATRTRPTTSRACRRRSSTRSPSSSGSEIAPHRVRRRRARPPREHRPPGVGRASTAPSPTGNAAATSSSSDLMVAPACAGATLSSMAVRGRGNPGPCWRCLATTAHRRSRVPDQGGAGEGLGPRRCRRARALHRVARARRARRRRSSCRSSSSGARRGAARPLRRVAARRRRRPRPGVVRAVGGRADLRRRRGARRLRARPRARRPRHRHAAPRDLPGAPGAERAARRLARPAHHRPPRLGRARPAPRRRAHGDARRRPRARVAASPPPWV